VVCGLLALCFVPAWVSIGVASLNTSGGGAALLIVMGVVAAFDLWLFLQAAATLRAGRLVLFHDRALLPRVPLAPLTLLSPPELIYRQVERFGLGTWSVRGGSGSPVLLFQVRADGPWVHRKVLRLSLHAYADPRAVLRELTTRIGFDPESLTNNWLGDVRFRG
jgi:hypothetical protein